MIWLQKIKLRVGRSLLGGDPASAPLRAKRLARPWHELGDRALFLDYAFKALTYNAISGDYAEFGCAGVNTFTFANQARTRHRSAAHLWAFDSFAGLPAGERAVGDDHPKWVEGAMSLNEQEFHRLCARRGINRASYTTVPGFYCDSLADPTGLPDDIALAYIDCDMRSSTRDVLQFLWPRLKTGMIIAFDDWFCWGNSGPSGEQLALEERLPDKQWRFEPFIQYGWHGRSFVVFPANRL